MAIVIVVAVQGTVTDKGDRQDTVSEDTLDALYTRRSGIKNTDRLIKDSSCCRRE